MPENSGYLVAEVRGAETCGTDTLLRAGVNVLFRRGLSHDTCRSEDDQRENHCEFAFHFGCLNRVKLEIPFGSSEATSLPDYQHVLLATGAPLTWLFRESRSSVRCCLRKGKHIGFPLIPNFFRVYASSVILTFA